MANAVVEHLWRWTDGGRLPVVVDATSCTFGLVHEVEPYLEGPAVAQHRALRILDSIQWARDELLPRLEVRQKVGSAVIHATCAGTHLGLGGALADVAGALAEEVTVPGLRHVLRLRRRPRDAAPGAGRRRRRRAGRRTRGPGVRRLPVLQPHLRAGHDQGDRPRLRVASCSCWTRRPGSDRPGQTPPGRHGLRPSATAGMGRTTDG